MKPTPITSRFAYPTISIVLIVAMLWFGLHSVRAQESSSQVEQIKVAYIANFIRFTQWEKDQKNGKQPWVITIIGDTDFANHIRGAFPNNKYMDRPVEIVDMPQLLNDKKELSDITNQKLLASHIIYFRNGNQQDHQAILALSRTPDFLYISDMPDSAKTGCMIELFNLKSRIAFKVNARAINNAKIHVSSKVLRLGIPAS